MFRCGHIERLLLSADDQLATSIEDRREALATGLRFVEAIEHATPREKSK